MRIRLMIAALALGTGLAACTPGAGSPTPAADVSPATAAPGTAPPVSPVENGTAVLPVETATPSHTPSPGPSPTRTPHLTFTPRPSPTPSSTPTITPTPHGEGIRPGDDPTYLQDGGALPPGALARIGIGSVRGAYAINDGADILFTTSTGLYAYDRATFERTWRRYLTRDPLHFRISPDGRRIVADFEFRGSPIVYDTRDGRRIATLDGWYEAHWSPGGTRLAVEEVPPIEADFGPFTARINLYDGQTGAWLRALEVEIGGFYGGVFRDIVWSPDGRYLAACGEWGTHIWDALSTDLLYTMRGEVEAPSCGIAFSPDGEYLVRTDVTRWFVLDLSAGELVSEQEGQFDLIGWSGDDLIISSEDGLSIVGIPSMDILNQSGMTSWRRVMSPSGDRIGIIESIANQNDVAVMSLPTLTVEQRIPVSAGWLEWSPGGRWLVGFGSIGDAQTLSTLIDTASGEPRYWLASHNSFLDDATLVVWDNETIFLFDLLAGERTVGVRYGVDVAQMGWSADGDLLLVDGEGVMWVWTEDTEQVRRGEDGPPLGALQPVEPFDWRTYEITSESPDGRFRAEVDEIGGCGDGPWGGGCGIWLSTFTLTRIDGADEQVITTFDNDNTGVSAFAWSPDGSMLAVGEGGSINSSASNSEIIMLGLPDGGELFRLSGHLGSVDALAFSPDGSRLASASADGSVIVWNVGR